MLNHALISMRSMRTIELWKLSTGGGGGGGGGGGELTLIEMETQHSGSKIAALFALQ